MFFLALGLALFSQTPPPQAEPYEILELPPGAELLWRGSGYAHGLKEHDPVSGLIATGTQSVSLWSDQDGREVFRFGDHDSALTALAFEPGELVATGDRSGRVVVRELSTGRKVHEFELGARVRELHFWPRMEGEEAASVLQVRCWGSRYSAWRRTSEGFEKIPVEDREAYAKLPEDEWSAIGVQEQTWVTHSSGRRLELNRIQLPGSAFQCVVDRSGTRLSLLPKTGSLRVYSIPDGEECTASRPNSPMDVLSFGLPEGDPYSAVTKDGYSYYCGGPTVNARYTTSTLASPAHRAVSANGQFIADFEEGELSRGNERVPFRSPGAPKALAVRNDGAVAIANDRGTVFVWTEDRPRIVGKRVVDIVGDRSVVDELCWLGNTDELFVLPVEGHPMVLDVSKRRFVGEIEIEFPVTEMIAYHPGRDTLLIGGGDRTLREYSRDLEPLGSMEFPGEPLILARPYGETRVLALSNYDHIVHAIDLETWTVLWECDLRSAIDLRIDENRGSFFVRCWRWTEERSLSDGRMLSRVVFYEGGAWLREAEDGTLTCSPGLDLAVRLADGRMMRTATFLADPEPR